MGRTKATQDRSLQTDTKRRSTRRARNQAIDEGVAISPLHTSLPAPTRGKAAQISRSRPIAQPVSSNDDADDTSSQPRDSRSQSMDESESPSTTPPAVQQPLEHAGRGVSASRSVSTGQFDPQPTNAKRGRSTATRKLAAPKTRKPVASKSTKVLAAVTAAASRPRRGAANPPESSSMEESDSKTSLPGSFPSTVDSNNSVPSGNYAAERTSTPVLQKSSSRKRSYESSTDRSVDSVSAKRFRNEKHTPSIHNHSFATERVALQSPIATPFSAATHLSQTPRSAQSTTAAVRNDVSDVNDGSTFFPEDESTPVPSTGLFAMARNLISRVSPTVRKRSAPEQSTPFNSQSLPSRNFTAPPETRTTLEDDFPGLFKLTPRPYNIKYPMKKPLPPKVNKSSSYHQEYAEDGEKNIDDDMASLHEEDVVFISAVDSRTHKKLIKDVNDTYLKHQKSLVAFEAAGLNGTSASRVNPKSQDQLVITVIEEKIVEKIVEVPTEGPSMPTDFPLHALIIPATASGDRMILTDSDLIEMVRSAVVFATSNPMQRLPEPDEMTEVLQRFSETHGHDSLVSDRPSTNATIPPPLDYKSPIHFKTVLSNPSDAEEPELLEVTMSGALPAVDDALSYLFDASQDGAQNIIEDQEESEVEELTSSPLISNPATTPVQHAHTTPVGAATTPSGASGFFSSMKAIFTTPLTHFGLGAAVHTGQTPAADNLGLSAVAHTSQIPAADNFSPSGLYDPKSPTPFSKQSQRNRKIQGRKAGVLRAQKKSSLRKKVGADADDIHATQRAQKRVAFNEKDEIHLHRTDGSSPPSPATGSKRKSRTHNGFDEENGTYFLPDSLFDSDSDDEESQNDGTRTNDSHTDESSSIDSRPVVPSAPAHYVRATPEEEAEIYQMITAVNSTNPRLRGSTLGNSTSGTSIFGNSTSGNSVFGNSTTGTPTSGNSTFGNSISGNSTLGNPTSGKSTPGNSTSGKSTSGTSITGKSTFGNSTPGNSTSGKSTLGNSPTGTGTPSSRAPIDRNFTNCDIPGIILEGTRYVAIEFSKTYGHLFKAPVPQAPISSSIPAGNSSVEESTDADCGTYACPEYDSDDDSSILNDLNEAGSPAKPLQSETDGHNGPRQPLDRDSAVAGSSSTKSVQNESSALTEKTWEQSVPPKPRPANATLPPPYNKYVPEKPSHLSWVKNMSPGVVVGSPGEKGGEENLEENVAYAAADMAPTPPRFRGVRDDDLDNSTIYSAKVVDDKDDGYEYVFLPLSKVACDAVDALPPYVA